MKPSNSECCSTCFTLSIENTSAHILPDLSAAFEPGLGTEICPAAPAVASAVNLAEGVIACFVPFFA